MKLYPPSPFLAFAIIATQVLGPVALWAAEQRGIRVEANRQIVVSALSGDQLTLQRESGSSPLQFREVLAEGTRVTTGAGTTAELLIGNRAVVTLGNGTTAQVRTVSTNQTTIQVTNGTVRVAAAASAVGPQGVVTVQTPTSQVQTHGGIVRVFVDTQGGNAKHPPTGIQVYRASYSPDTIVAAATPPSETIHVEEGTAEIPGVGPTGGPLTVKAGQRVTVQAGRAGSLAEARNPGGVPSGILATTGHTLTPKEGRDYLVALQVDQATKLGQALTGAAETGEKESEKKSDTKNVINGATGGVNLQTQDVFAKTFGGGGFFSGTGGNLVNRSGSATVDDSNEPFDQVGVGKDESITVKGGTGLLVFTERPNPAEVDVDESGERINAKLSEFAASKELLLVDGGTPEEAPHGGKAPLSTLVARAIVKSKGDAGVNVSLPLQWLGNDGKEQNAKVLLIINPPDKRDVLVERFVSLDGERDPSQNCIEGCYATGDSALSDFSNQIDGVSYEGSGNGNITSYVDGVISARSATTGNRLVTLTGGAVLDRQTTVSLGQTTATNAYFTDKPGLNSLGATKFNGSLLSVLASQNGGFNPAFVKMQDRLLGVLDGSSITETVNKKTALLSVLDSRVIGPEASDPSTGANGRKPREIAPLIEMDGVLADGKNGARPSVTVTSAVVVRSTDVPLDGALLSASSPLLAMMHANMTTRSHFADVAGNNGQRGLFASLVPGDALVRLNNATLTVAGNLLNLDNATAAVTGYLFSLDNGSTLKLINDGSLFSLNNKSSLTLTGNAFGVFGSTGTNTLTIDNNSCSTGPCGFLVNSANQLLTVTNTDQQLIQLKVAGVTQNVVLPNGFNAFSLAPGTTASNAKIDIDANDALFHIDPRSTLTINGTKVK